MAAQFPAPGGSLMPMGPDEAWTAIRQVAAAVRQQCAVYQAGVSGSGVSAQTIANMYAAFSAYSGQLTVFAAAPNIVSYAQAIVGSSFDIAGAFSAMQSALQAAASWIGINFPVNGVVSVGGQGQVIWVSFSAAQLAGLTPLITALAATIG